METDKGFVKMIKSKIEWFRIWNYWRKGNLNCLTHKIFVLFKIINSPTLYKEYIKQYIKEEKGIQKMQKKFMHEIESKITKDLISCIINKNVYLASKFIENDTDKIMIIFKFSNDYGAELICYKANKEQKDYIFYPNSDTKYQLEKIKFINNNNNFIVMEELIETYNFAEIHNKLKKIKESFL